MIVCTFTFSSFSPFSITMTIAQSSLINTPIVIVEASDDDQRNTPNSEISFSLMDPTLPFTIDSAGLLLTRSTAPDLEAGVYTVVVIISDNGIPSLNTTATITIDVAPPNFDAPRFQDNLTFSILENRISMGDVFSFEVSDRDVGSEGDVGFTLLQSEFSDNFTVTKSGRNEGTLTYNGGPGFDRERLSNFTLSIRATDQGNVMFRESTDAVIYVTIDDANDNPPVFVGAPYNASVSENAAVGTSIARASATDLDLGTNADIAYSLDYNGGEFDIDTVSGIITVEGQLLVANQSLYLISVVASDGIFEARTNITITLIEVNDNAPRFTPLPQSSVMVPENTAVGTVLMNISVSDDDTGVNGLAVLSLEQDGDMFDHQAYSEPNQFYIFLSRPLDFEVSYESD